MSKVSRVLRVPRVLTLLNFVTEQEDVVSTPHRATGSVQSANLQSASRWGLWSRDHTGRTKSWSCDPIQMRHNYTDELWLTAVIDLVCDYWFNWNRKPAVLIHQKCLVYIQCMQTCFKCHIHVYTYINIYIQCNYMYIHVYLYWEREREGGREGGRGRETDRQTDRHTHTHTHTEGGR